MPGGVAGSVDPVGGVGADVAASRVDAGGWDVPAAALVELRPTDACDPAGAPVP